MSENQNAIERSLFGETTRNMKIFRSFELISFIATLIGVIAWASEADNRRQERNARAWSLIASQASGNSGKTEALEYLANQNITLDGIDISCERMGGGWKAGDKTCERHVLLEDVGMKTASLESANLSGTYLDGGSFAGANLNFAKFEGAFAVGTDFTNAQLDGVSFEGALLAGTDFIGAKNLDTVNFTGAWTMENNLPIGLMGIELMVCPKLVTNLDLEKPTEDICPKKLME